MPKIQSRTDVYKLLLDHGASARLIRHLELVGEAGGMLIEALSTKGVPINARLVELGIAVHDAGKILFPAELDGPGSQHEAAGERMLLDLGVDATVAHCCVSHAAWAGADVTLEERLVALADKLWKQKREEALELLVIDEIADRLSLTRWDVFSDLDALFEDIAAGATDRLERSRV